MTKKIVAIYCRESTDKQDIDGLVAMCEVQAKKLGFTDYTIYKDVGSGMERNRPNYLRLLDDVKNNKINILILYESSRLTRDSLEHQATYRLLQQHEVKLYILNRGWVDPNDDNDEFVSSLLNLIDTKEVRQIRKRAKDKMAHIKDSGFWTGGTPPTGYKLIDKKLFIDHEKAPIVKEIFRLFLSGMTRSKIASIFQFESKRVYRILNNPIYIGYLKKNQIITVNRKPVVNKEYQIVKGQHDAIISKDDWDLTQSLLKSITIEKDTTIRALQGLIKCRCGNPLYHKAPDKSHNKLYYICKQVDMGCKSKVIIEDEMLEAILDELEEVIKSLDSLEIEDTDNSAFKEQLTYYSKELEKFPKKEELLLDKYLEGAINNTLYENKLDEIKIKKKEYQLQLNKLETLEADRQQKQNTKGLLFEYFTLLKTEKNPEKLNHFFRIIIDRIELINDFRFIIHLKI